ncbi:DUF998 domain-containing protein [Bailinhaonella thermotolerans]|uniref:DUF998 domain-containing protein n=1 Tax=Bailinhaonella thermotolerans TaxID=1070861 RepID=A0A3A4BFD1_9ACTN|nr:DUF998 domain-containing protein [Bailinhaonella thermotolerans]RJL30052.1 DUF998 domain-containing protein [Bailinhaonella thermotolerans]
MTAATPASASAPASVPAGACSPRARVTRSLLGWGVVAGPMYVTVTAAQVLTREGFDITRHPASLLANGGPGWIQIANLVLTGVMTLAAAVGMRRALRAGRGSTWGPRLVFLYGLGVVAAGIFRADPAFGFPAGTPDGPGPITWHGMLHFALGGVGFLGLIGACLVFARAYAAMGRRAWAAWSAATGLVFLAAFAGIASGPGNAVINLAFTAAVVLGYAWLTATSAHLMRQAT